MNGYHFDLSNFTIGDAFELQAMARENDVQGVMTIANRFISINLFALPMNETGIVLQCFLEAVAAAQSVADDPITSLIRKALEDTE